MEEKGNIVVKQDDPEANLAMNNVIEIKLEPLESLDQASVETFYNVYDTHFEVVKHEPCEKVLEVEHYSEKNVNKRCPSQCNASFPTDITKTSVTSELVKIATNAGKNIHRDKTQQYEIEIDVGHKSNDYNYDTSDEHNINSQYNECSTPTCDTTEPEITAIKQEEPQTTINLLDNQATSQHKLHTSKISAPRVVKVDTNVGNISLNNDVKAVAKKCKTKARTKERLLACDLCSYKCKFNSDLVRHMRTHTGEKPYHCNQCSCKYAQRTNLIIHLRTHTDVKPYNCRLCSYKCTNRNSLVLHMRIHTGEKPFKCEVCQNRFTHNTHLLDHMKTHTGEKPYNCTLCSYRCAKKSNLAVHMKSHSDEKPFSCQLCPYKCRASTTLLHHMGTHTGEMPLACTECSYKCAKKSHLVRHMRTHSGEKPFSCELCPYKCTKNRYLVAHMRTHVGVPVS